MKNVISLLILIALVPAAFANGVSLNSPGTRAISMGGAYISIADDYSAPYWNPSGLMNIDGMQASIFVTDIIPMASYETTLPWATVDAEAEIQHMIAPNAAFLWTCTVNPDFHLGLSFIVPAGLGVEWNGDDLVAFSGPPAIIVGQDTVPNPYYGKTFDWESSIAVFNISLSAAYRLTDCLNIGGAFHMVRGDMTMKRPVDAICVVPGIPQDQIVESQYAEESGGWGTGFGFGLQYMPVRDLTFAASIRTRMRSPG
mgnify:CR=1 FL=1